MEREIHTCSDNKSATCERQICERVEYDPRSYCHSICATPHHICGKTTCGKFLKGNRQENEQVVCIPTRTCHLSRRFGPQEEEDDTLPLKDNYENNDDDFSDPQDVDGKPKDPRRTKKNGAKDPDELTKKLLTELALYLDEEKMSNLISLGSSEICPCCNCGFCTCNRTEEFVDVENELETTGDTTQPQIESTHNKGAKSPKKHIKRQYLVEKTSSDRMKEETVSDRNENMYIEENIADANTLTRITRSREKGLDNMVGSKIDKPKERKTILTKHDGNEETPEGDGKKLQSPVLKRTKRVSNEELNEANIPAQKGTNPKIRKERTQKQSKEQDNSQDVSKKDGSKNVQPGTGEAAKTLKEKQIREEKELEESSSADGSKENKKSTTPKSKTEMDDQKEKKTKMDVEKQRTEEIGKELPKQTRSAGLSEFDEERIQEMSREYDDQKHGETERRGQKHETEKPSRESQEETKGPNLKQNEKVTGIKSITEENDQKKKTQKDVQRLDTESVGGESQKGIEGPTLKEKEGTENIKSDEQKEMKTEQEMQGQEMEEDDGKFRKEIKDGETTHDEDLAKKQDSDFLKEQSGVRKLDEKLQDTDDWKNEGEEMKKEIDRETVKADEQKQENVLVTEENLSQSGDNSTKFGEPVGNSSHTPDYDPYKTTEPELSVPLRPIEAESAVRKSASGTIAEDSARSITTEPELSHTKEDFEYDDYEEFMSKSREELTPKQVSSLSENLRPQEKEPLDVLPEDSSFENMRFIGWDSLEPIPDTDVCNCLPGYCTCGTEHHIFKKQTEVEEPHKTTPISTKRSRKREDKDKDLQDSSSSDSSCSCIHDSLFDDLEVSPKLSRVEVVAVPPIEKKSRQYSEHACKPEKYQRTLLIVKPEAVKFKDVILRAIKKEGLDVIDDRFIQITPEQVAEIYTENYGSSYFALFVQQMSSSPILVLSIAGFNAIQRWSKAIGKEKKIPTSWFYPPSVKRRFGIHKDVYDAMRLTDDFDRAKIELRYFFPLNIIDPIIVHSFEVQDYCDKYIHPTLLKGLYLLIKERPVEPLIFLAEWLLINNPYQPHYKQTQVALAPT